MPLDPKETNVVLASSEDIFPFFVFALDIFQTEDFFYTTLFVLVNDRILSRSALMHSLFGLALVLQVQALIISKNPNVNCPISAVIKCCRAVSGCLQELEERTEQQMLHIATPDGYCLSLLFRLG